MNAAIVCIGLMITGCLCFLTASCIQLWQVLH